MKSEKFVGHFVAEFMRAQLTWTLDSGKLIFSATSSRMNMSGYLVLPNSDSRMSSWARVKVVRSLRCFRGLTPGRNRKSKGKLLAKPSNGFL